MPTENLRVRANPGRTVPREGNARRLITEGKAETVPNTVYYRRRITAGDLVEVSE